MVVTASGSPAAAAGDANAAMGWSRRSEHGQAKAAQALKVLGEAGNRRGLRRPWLGDLDSNQGCPVQSREFYR